MCFAFNDYNDLHPHMPPFRQGNSDDPEIYLAGNLAVSNKVTLNKSCRNNILSDSNYY